MLKLNRVYFLVGKWDVCGNFSSSFWRPEKISAPPDKFYVPLDFYLLLLELTII